MNKEKIFSIARTINIIPLVLFGLIFLLGSGYTLLGIFESAIFRVMMMGYIMALVFGILAYKKNYFLFLSLLGWAIFAFGNHLDVKNTAKGNNEACLELRRDPNCKEIENGSIDCESGKYAGIYPSICEGIDRN